MNFFEFVRTWNGKQVDVDGAYGAQCVDLARKYCDQVLGVGLYALPRGNAIDIFNAVPDNHKIFQKIYNTKYNVPKQGDIIFWGEPYGWFINDKGKPQYAGHVAIINTANVLFFTSFDQNWGTDKGCRIVNHNNFYKGVKGWLRLR